MSGIGEFGRLGLLAAALVLTSCAPGIETYMRPSAPGLSPQARDCSGAGKVLWIALPNGATAGVRTNLESGNFDFTLTISAPRDSKSHRGDPILIKAKGEFVLEWDGGRFSTPFHAPRYDGPGYFYLTRFESFGQRIVVKNFTAALATLTLPSLSVDGEEMQAPPITLERRSIPALYSFNC